MSANQALWIATVLGGKGKVLMDRGLAGAPVSQQLEDGFKSVLAKYPGIEIVGYFNGSYALGPEQAGVANLLAANPEVDGIISQAYGTGAIKALQDAGRKMVPITAAAFNGTALTCLSASAKCILGPNPPYLSAVAMRLAVDVLDGKAPASKTVLVETPLLTTDPVDAAYVGSVQPQKIALGQTAFPSLPPGLSLPVTPDWVQISPEEALGKN
jgi:ribose transport system substrate-binding protein